MLSFRSASRFAKTQGSPSKIRNLVSKLAVLVALATLGFGAATQNAQADDAGMRAFLVQEGAKRRPVAAFTSAPRAAPAPAPFAFAPLPSLKPVHQANLKPMRPLAKYLARKATSKTKLASGARDHARHMAMLTSGKPEVAKVTGTQEPIDKAAAKKELAPYVVRSSQADLLTDTTLRKGDVVVTDKGVRVFRGSQKFPYSERDFVALANAPQQSNSVVLAAIDRTMRGGTLSAATIKRNETRLAMKAAKKAARLARNTGQPVSEPLAEVRAFAPKLEISAATKAIEKAIVPVKLDLVGDKKLVRVVGGAPIH